MSRAHEKEFGQITPDNKVIWQIAEERSNQKEDDPTDNQEILKWLKCVRENTAVTVTLKNLGLLYRKQGKHGAATVLEDTALRAKREVGGGNKIRVNPN